MRLTAQTAMLIVAFLAGLAERPPPIAASLKAGQQHVYPYGALGVPRMITCTSHGIRIVGRVPALRHAAMRIADGPRGSATILLPRRRDGSVLARCR